MSIASAINDFRRARRRASLERILARLTGRSIELLSYDEVRKQLRAFERGRIELRDIPLEAIVGSVGRYSDFTRNFLPRSDSDAERWARVKVAVTDQSGVPPIEVYQIGDAYFVRDGNHRVSIARQLGSTHIEAYVTEVESKVLLSPDDQADDLIMKAEYADFLEKTQFDRLWPDADLSLTAPGKYPLLEEQIRVHRHCIGLEQECEIPYEEAVNLWYEQTYLPVVEVIRERGILRDFPQRTEADLYLWVSEHRATLTETLGQEVRTDIAAEDLADRFSPKRERVASRLGGKMLDAVTPDELEAGPKAGRWREKHLSTRDHGSMFSDVLVGLSGEEVGWNALEQALEIARREGARLHGLHIVPSEEQAEGEDAQSIKRAFDERCEKAGVEGELNLVVGEVARHLCERARFNDLVVVNLAHPPSPRPLAKLSSGFRTIVRRCPLPILATPGIVSPLKRALLAYDGSAKAEEALFVSTYLGCCWKMSLDIVSVDENGISAPQMLDRARDYLDRHGVQADFVQEKGSVPEAILKTAETRGSDLIVMGGYGAAPVVEVVLGSAVDHVLRASRQPMLICR
ncbi:MAG: universal stress protein [Anaerolineales bacterium]|nr:universal stress protein [Anaerolineales bacterium]